MKKDPKLYNGERRVSSINGVREIEQQYAKEQNWITFLYYTQKLKEIKILNIRLEP